MAEQAQQGTAARPAWHRRHPRLVWGVAIVVGLAWWTHFTMDIGYAERVQDKILRDAPIGSKFRDAVASAEEMGFTDNRDSFADDECALKDCICSEVLDPDMLGASFSVAVRDSAYFGVRRSDVVVTADNCGRMRSVHIIQNIHLRRFFVFP